MLKRKSAQVPKGKSAQTSKEAIPKEEKEVELSSLAVGQLFDYQGKTYSKRRTAPDGIRALAVKGTELKILAPDTRVTPK